MVLIFLSHSQQEGKLVYLPKCQTFKSFKSLSQLRGPVSDEAVPVEGPTGPRCCSGCCGCSGCSALPAFVKQGRHQSHSGRGARQHVGPSGPGCGVSGRPPSFWRTTETGDTW